ncbi:hypothetical protein, partial [Commensalibacter communis]
SDVIVNFTIPKGDKGEKGEQGIQGEKGDKGESYTNDGTVDLNVKSITSDNGQIKSNGNGKLAVQHFSSENGGVYSSTTDYDLGDIYYGKAPYLSFYAWKTLDNRIFYQNSTQELQYETFLSTGGLRGLIGDYSMNLLFDTILYQKWDADKGEFVDIEPTRKRMTIIGTEGFLGHDTVKYGGSFYGDPENPWYYGSRTLRMNPQKLNNIKLNRNLGVSGITNNYMAGTIGLATDYFTGDDDGFITPVIWDTDTDDSAQARALGVPYIPADKKDTLPDTTTIAIGTQSFDINTKKPCWWDGNQWIETCVNNGTADLNVKSINESALVGASGQTLENLLDNSIKVVSVSDATSDNFIEKVKNNKISDVKMVGELLSDNKVIDIANNNDIAEGNIIKISVDSVPTANADEFNKYGIQIRLYVPMVNGDTSMSDGSTAEKMRQLVVTLYYGDILFLKHIGSSSMFGITFPIYHANISRGDQILTDLSQYVVNDGTVDLNVKSINSDNGLIKSDGQGNLTTKSIYLNTIVPNEYTDNESNVSELNTNTIFSVKDDTFSFMVGREQIDRYGKKETKGTHFNISAQGIYLNGQVIVSGYARSNINSYDAKLIDTYTLAQPAGILERYVQTSYLNFERFKIFGDGNSDFSLKNNNGWDYLEYDGIDIFQSPYTCRSVDGKNAIGIKTYALKGARQASSQTLFAQSVTKILGHDSINVDDSLTSYNTRDPWYFSSRLFRMVPKKISDIVIKTQYDYDDVKTITSHYMAGTVGFSTNYFTKSDDDTKQDGFITPVIWDVDTDDVTKGRTLGVPYIPADKKITLPDTANIEVGTQSFDTNSKKPCWWDGSKWVNVIIDGQRAENLIATSAKIYRLEFIDSWNTYINFPNMWGATYGARTKNNGITQRYFEKTRTAAERKQIETDIANEISDPTRKQTALDNIANKQYTDSRSAGLFPNYNVFQMYNRNTFVNLNNYYFDGPLVSTGAVNLGKISDLTSDSIIQDGAVALNSSKLPSVYNATNKSWSNIPVKQKYIGDIANDSSEIIVDTFKVKLIAGATGGISLATTSGTIKVSGFHECLYAATGNGNQLVDATLTASFVSIPDLGITVDHEHRKMWFWNTTTPDDNLYFVELFKRGSKVIMQVWKE